MAAAAMSNYYDAEKMVETMLAHESIKKAIRVFKETGTSFDADEIAEQYCEFMALKVLSGDFSAADAKLSPGGAIDAFWHSHILDTVGYPAFFKAVVPPLGPLVNHDAEKSHDDEAEIKARQEKTKEVYQTVFKETCPFFEHDDSPRPRKKQKVSAPEVVIIRNPFNVIVQTLTGATSQFEIGPNNTVRHLKLLYQGMHHVPHDQQRLIFAGAQMKDENTLADYNIVDGSTVQQVLKLKGC